MKYQLFDESSESKQSLVLTGGVPKASKMRTHHPPTQRPYFRRFW